MPLPIAPASLQAETLLNFTGVNLRRDRLSLADEDCARAINADFHTKPGLALTRGSQVYVNTMAYGAPLAWIGRHLGARFLATQTQVFHEDTLIATGLNPDGIMYEPARGVGDPTEWLYIANRARMQKYSATTTLAPALLPWGITPPAAALTAAGVFGSDPPGSLTGIYSYVYTYVRKEQGAVAAESLPSPASPVVTVDARNIALSRIDDSLDTQVTHKRIYRTLSGGGLFLLEQELLNGAGTTTATSSLPDVALGAAASLLHDPPPLANWCTEFQGSMFLCGNAFEPHLLYYSEPSLPESFPPFNYLAIEQSSDALLSMTRMLGFLGIFTARTKYRITGNTTTGFIYTETPSTRGIVTPTAFCHAESGIAFLANDGLYLTSFLDADQPIHALIESLWSGITQHDYAPIDFTQPDALSVAYWKQRYYISYRATDGQSMVAVYSLATQKWYFYTYGEGVSHFYSDTATGALLAGTDTGKLTQVEMPTARDASSSIPLLVEPATRFLGDRSTRKTFTHLRADVTGPVALDILIDDEVRYRMTLDGVRQRRYQRLPDHLDGYTWRVRCRALSPATIASITIYAKPYQAGN